MKKMILALALAATSLACAWAQEATNMYLIKGDRVVGKYDVDAVDYVSFKLPEGVNNDNLWLAVDNVGKNTVTYTVSTIDENTTYAHGIVSWYDLDIFAQEYYGDLFDNLDQESQVFLLKTYLQYVGYLGVGTTQVTMHDWQYDNYKNINVTPGTKYYLCAWEIDPTTNDGLDCFAYVPFITDAPGDSPAELNVTFKRQNDRGLAFELTGDDSILYVQTVFGEKGRMTNWYENNDPDYLFGAFGQCWSLEEMQGASDVGDDIEAATWPAYETGDYVLMVRAFDVNGDMVEKMAYAHYEAEEVPGPEIKVFYKSKGDGKVSVNFEISPSNVAEAYVNLMLENDVDLAVNDGWELWELASKSTATDITSEINTMGEYTFKAENLGDSWYTLLIYAKDKDGAKSTMQVIFNMLEDSNWVIRDAVHAPARRAALARPAACSRRPALNRVK